MWELRRLTTLWAFTTCYRDSFSFTGKLFKIRVLRTAVGIKTEELARGRDKYILRSFILCNTVYCFHKYCEGD
jgi:hypothetical protein